MDYTVLFTPISTGAIDAVEAVAPLGIPIFIALVGLGIGLRLFAKFGVKR